MSSGALPRKEEKKNEIHLDKGSATGDEKQKKTERKMKYISTGALPRGEEKKANTFRRGLPRREEKKANTFRQGLCLGGKKRKQKHFDRGSAPGGGEKKRRLISENYGCGTGRSERSERRRRLLARRTPVVLCSCTDMKCCTFSCSAEPVDPSLGLHC